VLAGAASVALGACGGSEPTPEMTRSANLVLGKSVAGGSKRLGECLESAGYDTDSRKVAGDVTQGKDITITGKTERVFAVPIQGSGTITFAVTYESGFVLVPSDQDKARLEKLGCAPEYG
jgi:hypothetical protein